MSQQNNISDDNYDPDDPDSNNDIDQMIENVTGDEPTPGVEYSISDEVQKDEEEH
jgi:hypothetical protein